MSKTVAQITPNVRQMLNDVDPAMYAIDGTKLNQIIVRRAQLIAQEAGIAETWVTAAFTSTPGSLADVTLPTITNAIYQAVLEIWDPVNGRPLDKLTPPEINYLRRGIVSGVSGMGDPISFAIWPDTGDAVKLRFDRVPSRAIAYDLKRQAVVPELFTDAASIDFGSLLLRGLECDVAIEAYLSLPEDQRQRLKLPTSGPEARGLVESWQAVRRVAVLGERQRSDRLKGRPYGVGAVVS